MPTSSALVTLSDWLAAGADFPRLRHALCSLADAVQVPSDDPAWILRLTPQQVHARIEELQTLCALLPDADERRRRYPLFGVPFVVKDNIDVAGLATTAACPAWSRVASDSATVVHKLIDAGAVLLGKANLDQFATGLVGTRSPYGAPSSTWDALRVSGGSSAGSAVLVARGLVPFALGTDTAGSGRVPAGFNHIVGLKPTPGRVSTAGVLPACRSLDCVSVFAMTVEDAAAVLAVIEGPDAADAYSDFRPGPAQFPAPLRVGVPLAPSFTGDAAYAAAWQQALARLQSLGITPVQLDFDPLHAVAALLYEGPWVAERYAVVQSLLDGQPQALDATVAQVIGRARGLSAVQTFRAQYELQAARQRCAAIWQQVDLLMVPTAPGHPTLAQVARDPVGVNAALGHYTNFVNLLGWAALALPAGLTAEGLPFGVSFLAPGHADAALAQWGARWQAACAQPLGATHRAWSAVPPGLPSPAAEPELKLAVVGAHLSGLPLNGQLLQRRARLLARTTTAPHYRLFALPPQPGAPRKPGLLRVAEGGQAIALEVWTLPQSAVGSLLALVAPPLGLGSVELSDGEWVHGFLCEAHALAQAQDISALGGWRAWLATQ